LTDGRILLNLSGQRDRWPANTLNMTFLTNIPSWLKNKYLLTGAGFVVWILFFDNRDLITSHFREKGELNRLEKSKKYYEQQIATTKLELEQLKSNPALLEKYAREKYLMKKDNEDLFLIRGDRPTINN
jgi:cell division protein DivIC